MGVGVGGGGGVGGAQVGPARRPTWVHGSPMKIVMRDWAAAADRTHLSPKGYKEFARWVYGPVVDSMPPAGPPPPAWPPPRRPL